MADRYSHRNSLAERDRQLELERYALELERLLSEPPSRPAPPRKQATLDKPQRFNPREWLWQKAIPVFGLEGANNLIGSGYYGDGGLSFGDFAGLGILDGIAGARRGDVTPTVFGALEAAPLAGGLLKAARRGGSSAIRPTRDAMMSPGDSAASVYMIGDRLSPASAYRSATAGRPSQFALPGGERFDAKPINPIEQAAVEYMQRRGMDAAPLREYPQFSEERARLIAAAYDQMLDDPGNPAVKRAYDAMVQETLDQYIALKNSGIDFKFLRKGMVDPYKENPALGYRDIVENGRLYVFPTDFGYGSDVGSDYFDPRKNPLLVRVGQIGDKSDAVANDAFRAVHDAYGHFGPGNPFFRHKGEERAFLEHSRMYSPEARGAMTSETRGQNSWLNSGPHGAWNRRASTEDTIFADQKIGLMPEWAYEAAGMPTEEEIGLLNAYINRGWK